MTTNTINRPRKNLADQINRLDSILDGLSDNLNEAVASAVQQAVAAAVKEAVTTGVTQAIVEVLTNPELRLLLHPPKTPAPPVRSPPPSPPAPSESKGGGGFLGGLWLAVRGTVKRVAQAAGRAASAVGGRLAATAQKARDLVVGGVQKVCRGARTLYARVLTSRVAKVVGVGGLVAAGCCLGSPALAGAVGGAALAAAAAVSQLPAHLLTLLGRTAFND
jgi:hypothetical protein